MLNPAFTPALLRSMPCLRQEEDCSRIEDICYKILHASATDYHWIVEWVYMIPSDDNERYVTRTFQPFIDQGFNVLIEPEHGRYKVTISWELTEGETAVSHSLGHSAVSPLGHSAVPVEDIPQPCKGCGAPLLDNTELCALCYTKTLKSHYTSSQEDI